MDKKLSGLAFALTTFFGLNVTAHALEVSGLVQVSATSASQAKPWQDAGTGVVRYNNSSTQIQQAVLAISQDIGNSFSLEAVGNINQDGEKQFGISQAQLVYKPLLASPHKWRVKAGFLYPAMSLENVDSAWLSPYQYNNSVINSWIGEELRVPGIEISQLNPGRARRSAWSYDFHLGLYKGNDPLGTLIAWRGWATHDRQSLFGDRVNFAAYPSVVDRANHPNWVQPFHEVDGRVGYYLGAHLNYYNRSRLRYYYYDNNADPTSVNSLRQYAWHTRFHSLAAEHRFSKHTNLIGQWMSGSTKMGYNWVFVDFKAWFVMLSHVADKHRFSAKVERFSVREDDVWEWDPNDSDGEALTMSWRYSYNEHWQFGLEHVVNHNQAANRATVNERIRQTQYQSLAVAQYRW